MNQQSNQQGQSLIEYLILVVIIALGGVALLKNIREKMQTKLKDVHEEIRDLKRN